MAAEWRPVLSGLSVRCADLPRGGGDISHFACSATGYVSMLAITGLFDQSQGCFECVVVSVPVCNFAFQDQWNQAQEACVGLC